MTNMALNYAVLDRYSEAVPLLEEVLRRRKAKLGPNDPRTLKSLYHLAVCHALQVPKAADRKKQGDLAMDWLKRAVAAGFGPVARLKEEAELNPLREREDFKKLIAE